MLPLQRCKVLTVRNVFATSHKKDWVSELCDVLIPDGCKNCIDGLKVLAIIPDHEILHTGGAAWEGSASNRATSFSFNAI